MKTIELKFKDEVFYNAIIASRKSFERKLKPSKIYYRKEDFQIIIMDESDEKIKATLERICTNLIAIAHNPKIGGFKKGIVMMTDKKMFFKALILDHQTPIISLMSIYPKI